MCDEESNDIGDIVPDERVIYRACTKSNFLTETKDSVREIAFQKYGMNHKDGLSLAFSPADSVKNVKKNHGVIAISVGAIHQLGRNLEVHFDLSDPTHVLIRNLPCMDRTSEERQLAEAVSAELAILATVASAKPVSKPAASGTS
jgi:hypothetical protein